MSYAQTIQSLTGGLYNELTYIYDSPITGSFIETVNEVLKKCDINIYSGGTEYNLQMQQAVMDFQSKNRHRLSATGILNNQTWQTMLNYAGKYGDTIQEDTAGTTSEEESSQTTSPHYNPFFSDSNTKSHRRNGKDIKIIFGNNSVTKTLKNVFMRSVSVEVDTSGNPISEVYEFIAQDVIESDESTDANKYTTPESFTDLKIQYSFERVMNELI